MAITPESPLYAKSGGNLATDIDTIGTSNVRRLIVKDGTTTVVAGMVNVPANITIEVERGAKLVKGASGAINFLGFGLKDPLARTPHFLSFAPGDITFTGGNAPAEISAELWDTANSSLMDRWKRADLAFPSKRVKVILYPRSILASDRITSSEYRHVHFVAGEYTNAYTGYTANGNKPPISFQSNFEITFDEGVILYTSTSNAGRDTALIQCDDATAQYENVFLNGAGCTIQGQSTTLGSGTSCIYLGNVKNGYIRYFTLRDVQDYAIGLGAFNNNGAYAEDCDASYNKIFNARTTVLVAYHGRRLKYHHNVIHAHDTVSGSNNFNGFDAEPNTPDQWIDGLYIEDNEFHTGSIPTSYFNAIQVLSVATGGIRNVHINRNKLNGSEIGSTGDDRALVAMNIEGVENLHINGNEVKGWLNTALDITKCRYGKASDNTFIRCGKGIRLNAAAEMTIAGNDIKKTVRGGGANINGAASIVETEVSLAVDASVTDAEFTANYGSGRAYNHFVGLTAKLNMQTITFASVTTNLPLYEKFTFTPTVGTPTGHTFTAATTDIITFGADPKISTGERVSVVNSGGALPAGLLSTTTYFFHRINSTTGKLSLTYSGGIAGVGVDITGTGTGTQTLTPRYLARKSFLAADINTGTDTIALPGHNNADGGRLTYNVTGLVPAPLVGGYEQDYHVVNATANTLQLSLTSGGAAITFTDTGAGTHSIMGAATGIIVTPFTVSGSTFTKTAHGIVNNTVVRVAASGTAIGGLTDGQEVFAISSADSLQLGATEALALAATAINLTSTGAGLHTLTPTARTMFSSNTIVHNIAPDGVSLESTGTSKNYPLADYSEQIADLDARLTAIEPDPNWFADRIVDMNPADLAATYADAEQIATAWMSAVGALEYEDNNPSYPVTFHTSGVNSKPFVRAGVNHGLDPSGNLPGSPTALTVALVAKTHPHVTNAGAYTLALNDGSSGTEGSWHMSLAYGGEIEAWSSGNVGDATYNLVDVQALVLMSNGTTAAAHLNGANITDDATKATLPARIRIGDPTDNVISRGAGVDIYRYIIWNKVLSTEELEEFFEDMAATYQ